MARATAPSWPLLALMRLAATDPDGRRAAAGGGWQRAAAARPPAAMAWAIVAARRRCGCSPRRWITPRLAALAARRPPGPPAPWSDDTLAWHVRAALRAQASDSRRWPLVRAAVERDERRRAARPGAWVYWRPAPAGAGARRAAKATAERQAAARAGRRARGLSFYGKLATEDLGRRVSLPPPPRAADRGRARGRARHPGPGRGAAAHRPGPAQRRRARMELHAARHGDRELLAAASWPASARSGTAASTPATARAPRSTCTQRFPTPFATEVVAKAREVGPGPGLVYGLIRQESRASSWTRARTSAPRADAADAGHRALDGAQDRHRLHPEMINDRDTNLRWAPPT
jgi:soluble lytic murein transglycosylase